MPEVALLPGQLRNLDQRILENFGGVETCWYVPVAEVLRVPDSEAPVLLDDVILKPGATWYQMLATRSTLRFDQPGKSDRHGPYFQPKLVGTLAKYSADLVTGLEAMDGHQFLLLHRDANGEVWLTGSLDEPLDWSETTTTGTDSANRNGTTYTFAADTTRRARAYRGRWTVSEYGVQSGAQLQGNGGTIEIRDRRGRLMATVAAGQTVVVKSGFRVAFDILS